MERPEETKNTLQPSAAADDDDNDDYIDKVKWKLVPFRMFTSQSLLQCSITLAQL
jgi:hypothetical protein